MHLAGYRSYTYQRWGAGPAHGIHLRTHIPGFGIKLQLIIFIKIICGSLGITQAKGFFGIFESSNGICYSL